MLFLLLVSSGCRNGSAPTPNVWREEHWSPPRPLQPTRPLEPPVRPPERPSPPSPVWIGPVTVVVDPGHGGRDPGARGLSPLPEKTITLQIALELADLLRQSGCRVTLTRTTDRYIELDDRADLAERHHADLFVSIHADAHHRSVSSGATVLVGRTAIRRSKRAARNIKAALERAGIESRPIRPQALRVCEAHSRPAVLVECGFLTNRLEAQQLNDPAYQSQIARALADGIADFFLY